MLMISTDTWGIALRAITRCLARNVPDIPISGTLRGARQAMRMRHSASRCVTLRQAAPRCVTLRHSSSRCVTHIIAQPCIT